MNIKIEGLGIVEASTSGATIIITTRGQVISAGHVKVEVSREEFTRFCNAGLALVK